MKTNKPYIHKDSTERKDFNCLIGKEAALELLTTRVISSDKVLVVDPAWVKYEGKKIPMYNSLFPQEICKGSEYYTCVDWDISWICVQTGVDGAYFIENKDIYVDSGSFCIFIRHPFDRKGYSLKHHDYACKDRLFEILDHAYKN